MAAQSQVSGISQRLGKRRSRPRRLIFERRDDATNTGAPPRRQASPPLFLSVSLCLCFFDNEPFLRDIEVVTSRDPTGRTKLPQLTLKRYDDGGQVLPWINAKKGARRRGEEGKGVPDCSLAANVAPISVSFDQSTLRRVYKAVVSGHVRREIIARLVKYVG